MITGPTRGQTPWRARRGRSAALLAATSIALAGCSSQTSTTPADSATTSSGAAASPSESSVPATNLIDFDGIGDYRVTMTAAQLNSTASAAGDKVSTVEDFCTLADGDGVRVYAGGGATGKVFALKVTTTALQTDKNVHVGSSRADVLAAYPDAVPTEALMSEGWLLVQNPAKTRGILFGFVTPQGEPATSGPVTTIIAGAMPEITYKEYCS